MGREEKKPIKGQGGMAGKFEGVHDTVEQRMWHATKLA